MRCALSLVGSVFLIAACSSGSGTGGGSGGAGSGGTSGSGGSGGIGGAGPVALCEAACKVCPDDPCADCTKWTGQYRDEFENALYGCVASGDACSQALWISCAQTANEQAVRRPSDDEYRDVCMEKKSVCDAEGGESFSDDVCLISNWYTEAHVAEAKACLSKTCTDTSSCLDALFD